MSSGVEDAGRLIRASRRIAVFTGAGVSAESGIPTFRGAGGVWQKYDPQIYADINYFRTDPSYYWSFFRDVRVKALVGSRPNIAHRAIFELERQHQLLGLITQNIDGLHRDAGHKDVIELHGNTRSIGCTRCEADYDFETVIRQLQSECPPRCRACGGVLKPRVVFFGELLPDGAMESAGRIAADCDLFLVVGSTLMVYPAASLPKLAVDNQAKLIIVNVGETELDGLADIKIDAKAGEVLPQIVGL